MTGVKNKTVLVTGATGGIGMATIRELIKEKADILAVDYNKKKMTEFQKEISSENIRTIITDLSKQAEIEALHKNISKELKEIDWIVCSAGFIDENEPKGVMNQKTIQTTFEVNTYGVMWLTKVFSPMITKGVIIISSTSGIWGSKDFPIYSASKAAVTTYGRVLARDFEGQGLSSIIVCPGPTNTKMREKIAGDAETQQNPDVIASLISSIIAGESEYKNGDTIIARDGVHKLHQAL